MARNICKMGTRRVELGPTGESVRENLARLRKGQGLTLRALADRLTGTDRPLSHSMISEIERGARRADVDDLATLAYALGVNPNALLMPHTDTGMTDVPVSAAGAAPAASVWEWLQGVYPLGAPAWWSSPTAVAEFQLRARPGWSFGDRDGPDLLALADDATRARGRGNAADTS